MRSDMEDEILDKIRAIIKPYVRDEKAFREISSTSHFIQDLKINSARLVDIVLAFEDEFHLSITDSEAESIQTVGDAMRLIGQKMSVAAK